MEPPSLEVVQNALICLCLSLKSLLATQAFIVACLVQWSMLG